ncbi:MAG TPA: glycosyltransferase family 4 protein [Kineosporiaceae bacterium]|nr:glycosyltransferase family 4 protein [Kineosporiaceae bacterium]
MQIHLLSSQSTASQAGFGIGAAPRVGHPHHLPHDLSAALRENGHQVQVDLLGDALQGQELTSLRQGAAAGRKIGSRLTGSSCVLHALDPVAWAAALTARSLADSSVVLRFSATVTKSTTERRAYRACLRAADAIAVAEDGDRRAAVRAGVSDERAVIVPDVVGLPDEQPDRALLRPGRTLLSLSGIGPDSGIATLLPALRWTPGRYLVVAGPGSKTDVLALRAELARLELTDRVRWLGWVDRTYAARLIDDAALVVLPSPNTGITAAIEAMIRSRAVATVTGGAAADVVVDGVTGSVLPADHPDLLGRTLRRLLNNPFRLEAMGLAGRERALTRYARSRALSATEQAYRIALGAA